MVRQGGVRVFFEGGARGNTSLNIEACRAFNKLAEAAGFAGRMPRFIACGGRRATYDQFVTARKEPDDRSMLLVDSEGPVAGTSPWDHVRQRTGDGWERPANASDDDLHFMIECMEAWLIADRVALEQHFQALKQRALPGWSELERVPKTDLYAALDRATPRGNKYDKGPHSFKVLEKVRPAVLRTACPSADRFFTELDRRSSRK